MDSNLESLSRLSLNLLDYLQNNNYEHLSLITDSFPEYYSRKEFDVTLRVGQSPDVEDFYCNSDVLVSQSQYFRTALSHNYITKDGNSIILEEPMVTPNAFRTLLRFLYKNEIDLNELDGSLFINIIKAAEHFGLNDILNELQRQIIECNSTWLQKNIVKVINGFFTDDSDEIIETIQRHLIPKISSNPEYLLESKDLGELKESCFIMLLSDVRCFMKQGIAWDILMLWGIRQSQNLKQNIPLWSFGEWTVLKETVKNVIDHIKFDQISRNDFYARIIPYSKVIPQNLSSQTLQHYLDKDVKSRYNDIFRRVFLDDSTLMNHYHADFILKWMGNNRQKNIVPIKKRKTIKRLFTFKQFSKLRHKSISQKQQMTPRKFNLLCRITTQNKEDPKTYIKNYKENCINRPNTLVLAKVHGLNTIIGGFSPSGLDHDSLSLSTPSIDSSFLFCFKNGEANNDDCIVSKMKNASDNKDNNDSYTSCLWIGPRFGNKDLVIDLNTMECICQPQFYNSIYDDKEFKIDECEIFQINNC
ncbi:7413_t:CDS:2 [Dentiscutata erythropus]|uniref:7413_t:CDS:1 n=1 Tax=Dentiscutata erythropus TaxID=1348616 RepID=A0A9N9NP69_9GLOM|nr:7413_t:CDS:2 [Dentiscutata erythropus]